METGVINNPNGTYVQPQTYAPAVYHQPAPMEDEAGANIDFWGIVRRRFFLILFFVLVAEGLGTLYIFTATPRYESKAKIQIIPEKPVVVNLGQHMFPTQTTDPMAKSHPNAMLSTDVMNGVLVEGGLIRSQTFAELANPARPDEIGQLIYEYLSTNLEIVQDRGGDEHLYELTFRSKYKEDSGRFLNSLVDVYRRNLTDGFQKDINESIKKLEETSRNFGKNLADAEQEIDEFRKNNPVPKLDPTGITEARKKVDILSPQLQIARERVSEKQSELELVNTFIAAGSPPAVILEVLMKDSAGEVTYGQAFKDHGINLLREQMEALSVRRSSLAGQLGAKNPQLVAIELQIVSLQKQIAERLANSSTAVDIPAAERLQFAIEKLKTELKEREYEADNLARMLAEYTAEAEKYAKIMQKEEELVDKKQRLYDTLSKAQNSVEEMRGARNDRGYKFNVLNRAADGVQVEPRPMIVFGLASVMGVLVGFGIAYLVDLADKTFRSPHEIIRTLNLALIGHIPVIRGSKAKGNQSNLHPVLCTFHKPKSQTAESFRAVRTAIYFSTQGQKNQVIQVTSPTPGDGKSTLATNLAITIAQSGKRVLLVDGDMRRPSLHKLFKVEDKPGFSDVLAEQVPLSEAIRQTEIDGLEILPCGVKPVQPAELLTSHRLPEVLAELRVMYDMVIIDTPPVLVVTDPCPIAANVDGVICAMRIKKNVRVSAERMVEILRSVNANIIGIVVNGVGAQGTYSSQYSYGAYQSGYSNYAGYGYNGYGYGRYGQSERPYDDNRRPELALPRRRIVEPSVSVVDE